MPSAEASPSRRDSAADARTTTTKLGPGLIVPIAVVPRMLRRASVGSILGAFQIRELSYGRDVGMVAQEVDQVQHRRRNLGRGQHRVGLAAMMGLVVEEMGQYLRHVRLHRIAGHGA